MSSSFLASLFQWLTFSDLKAALASRLGDPLKVHWIDDELGRYIKEALRTYNAISQLQRTRVVFPTKVGKAFYDLTSTADPDTFVGGTGVLTTNPPLNCGYSILDQELINDIQYPLIEPITTNFTVLGLPPPTDQFTLDDITRAIERRRNLFLLHTATHISHSQPNYPAPPNSGRVPLSDSTISLRRISWRNADGAYTPLYREDENEANLLLLDWGVNSSIPQAYAQYLTPPSSVQIIPPSNDAGKLDILSTISPADLNPAVGTLLSIPDDWAWVLKYGSLSDLLTKDSQSSDPRFAYAEQRYVDGLRLASMLPLIQQAVINGSYVQPTSLSDLDAAIPSWQNDTPAAPTTLAIAGRNLVALYPVPDSAAYEVQLDITRNFPVPVISTDKVQIPRESIARILDYCVHLATFKEGLAEFEQTYPLATSFMQHCLLHNSILSAEASHYDIVKGFSSKEEIDRPRYYQKEEVA